MKPIITAARIRSIIADARTERDVTDALRRHRVPYTFTTETGSLSIRIPCRAGAVHVFRSGSAPVVAPVIPCPFRSPVLHNDY